MNALPEYRINCCHPMKEHLSKGALITVQECEPFNADAIIPPTAFILSDGGHGGIEPIKYCPFCGAEIQIITTK